MDNVFEQNSVNDPENDKFNASTWDKFMKMLMDNRGICYISDKEMEADSGRTYTELFHIMPDWGNRLHRAGNMLAPQELKTIFVQGLLLWYVKYFTGLPTQLLRFTESRIQEIVKSPRFFEFKQNCALAMQLGFRVSDRMQGFYILDNYQNVLERCGYRYLSTAEYLNGTGLIKEYKDMIRFIVKERGALIGNLIEAGNGFELDDSKIDRLEIISPNQMLQKVQDTDPFIVQLGIVFQRWKVVLEKLIRLCEIVEFRKDSRRQEIGRAIVVVDRILTRIQELIFYDTRKICFTHMQRIIGYVVYQTDDKKSDMESGNDMMNMGRPEIYQIPVYKMIVTLLQDPNHCMNRPVHDLCNFRIESLFTPRVFE